MQKVHNVSPCLIIGHHGYRGMKDSVACENIRSARSSPLGRFRAEERLRLSDRNSILMTQIKNVDNGCISFCRSSAKRQVKTSQDDTKLCQPQLLVNKSQMLDKFSAWILFTTTSCKNVETLSRKNNLSCFKSRLITGLWDKILTSLLPPFKVVSPSFEHGLVLLATLKRGGGGFASTRSWTGHLSQNTVQCLKYFCNWL